VELSSFYRIVSLDFLSGVTSILLISQPIVGNTENRMFKFRSEILFSKRGLCVATMCWTISIYKTPKKVSISDFWIGKTWFADNIVTWDANILWVRLSVQRGNTEICFPAKFQIKIETFDSLWCSLINIGPKDEWNRCNSKNKIQCYNSLSAWFGLRLSNLRNFEFFLQIFH